jgi:hypothetical protein
MAGALISSICCASCSVAGTCADQVRCAVFKAGIAGQPGINLNPTHGALSKCGTDITDIFPLSLAHTTFAHYCPFSCNDCPQACADSAFGTHAGCAAGADAALAANVRRRRHLRHQRLQPG